MDYLPAKLLRPSKLDEVSGPAIVLPDPGREETFLVTGEERPYVCFLKGSHIGEGFLKEKAARWGGMAVEGVSFEVDLSSAFKPAVIDQPLGALIRAGTELIILVGTTDHHGFKEATRVTLLSGLPDTSANTEVGFKKWRAVIGEEPNRLVVLDYEAARTANAA